MNGCLGGISAFAMILGLYGQVLEGNKVLQTQIKICVWAIINKRITFDNAEYALRLNDKQNY